MSETKSHAPSAPRPGVLSLSIKEKSALFAAYMPFLRGGGIFIPTTKAYQLGDEVFMLLTLMDDPNKIPVAGHVAWITPSGSQGNKTQGIGVQFSDNESGKAARNKIEGLLGGSLQSTRTTHTM
jgi:type IV pilus assembly protein PilZ